MWFRNTKELVPNILHSDKPHEANVVLLSLETCKLEPSNNGYVFSSWLVGKRASAVCGFCGGGTWVSSSTGPGCRTGQWEGAQIPPRSSVTLQAQAVFAQPHFMRTWGLHPHWHVIVLRGFYRFISDSFWRGSLAVTINLAGLSICLKHVEGPSGLEAPTETWYCSWLSFLLDLPTIEMCGLAVSAGTLVSI